MSWTTKVFIGLLLLIVAAVLGYAGFAAYKVHAYNRLSVTTPVTEVKWSVRALNDEKYKLQAAYRYIVDGTTYEGITLMPTAYRNPWAAEQAIKEVSSKTQKAWFDPKDPTFSSLEKSYPTKSVVYAAILFALLNYFVWGGYLYTKNMIKPPEVEKKEK